MRGRQPVWFACLAVALLATPALAEDGRRSASDFHRRAVVEGDVAARAAYAVALDAQAVEALKHGKEVRVFDAAGREIPSLVHTATGRNEVIDRPVNIFNRSFSEDGTQNLSVELEGSKPPPANEFVFDIANEQYNLRVRVEASDDAVDWQILRDGLHLIRHTVKTEKIAYRHDVLRVPTARFRFYRFSLRPTFPPELDSDALEEPLEIRGVAVREIVRRGSALAIAITPEPYTDERDSDSRHDYYKLDLGRENLGVDEVVFRIASTDFARSVSLWEWSPERQRRTRQLASTVAFHYGDDVHSEFSGFTTDSRVLVLMIDQGDNEAVEVSAARASRPRQQVRFVGPSSTSTPIALYFDPDEPREPRYDLERRLLEHEITSYSELVAGPLEDNPDYVKPPEPRSETVPYLLYVFVVPLVLGLGWYVFRTISRGLPPQNPE